METKDMCKQNGLILRGKTYYFQARIPQDCLVSFPRPILRERLTATTITAAKAQVRQKWAELEARLERLRHPPTTVKEEDASHILAALVASRLNADEELRQEGLDDDAAQRVTNAIDELDRGERRAATRGDIHGIEKQAADWLRAYGYDLPADSPQFRSFALRFARASQTATRMLTLRQRGDFVETPKVELQVANRVDHKATTGAPLLRCLTAIVLVCAGSMSLRKELRRQV